MSDPWHVTRPDGVAIAVHELGGHGEPFLFAHATGFCAPMYRPLARALAHRFRVVAVDARGHGVSSPPPDGAMDWDEMAADLLGVVDALGGGPLHAFGHSLGGALVLLAEHARPGTFRSAFLFEPIVWPAGMARTGPNVMADAARARRPVFASRAEVLWRYSSRPPLDALRADALHAYVQHGFVEQPDGSVRIACDPEHEARVFEAEVKVTTTAIAHLQLPVTVACGYDEPGPNPGRLAPDVVEALDRAVLRRYDHMGHFGPFQDPVTVGRAVVEHLAWAAGDPGA